MSLKLFVALLLQRTVSASGTFSVLWDDPEFALVEYGSDPIDFRLVTTRTWLPACYMYDFLQGSGWFPMAWYPTFEPSISQSGTTTIATYEINRSPWASLCGAQPDDANFFWMSHPSSNGTLLEGAFRIIPDEKAGSSVAIECGPVDVVPGSCDCGPLMCDEARLDWAVGNDVEITVVWKPH